jgi:hypothetical protein
MDRTGRKACLFLSFLFFSSCRPYRNYQSGLLLPQSIRQVAIANFENDSGQAGLEKDLTRRVVHRFLQDGRVQLEPVSKALGLLAGSVRSYQRIPLQFDELQNPVQFKLILLVDLEFRDTSGDTVFWTTYPRGRLEGQGESPLTTEQDALMVSQRDLRVGDLSQASPYTRIPAPSTPTAASLFPVVSPQALSQPTPLIPTTNQAQLIGPPSHSSSSKGTLFDSASTGVLEEDTTYFVLNNLGQPAETEEVARVRLMDAMAERVWRRVMEGENH